MLSNGRLEVYRSDGRRIAQFRLPEFVQVRPGVVETMSPASAYADESGDPVRWRITQADGTAAIEGDASELGLRESIPAGALVNINKMTYRVDCGH